jgi:hypothetical protein
MRMERFRTFVKHHTAQLKNIWQIEIEKVDGVQR